MNRNVLDQSFLLLLAALLFHCHGTVPAEADDPAASPSGKAEQPAQETPTATAASATAWKPLVGSWAVSKFGGEGPVEIQENLVVMGYGDPLTGIRWEGDVPRENFEVELEARRADGFDFFCGLTFPVGKDHVSFILGGWGGGVVGISSIDGSDASENETTQFRNFDNNRWYKVRVRVEPTAIRCWIDDKLAVEQAREGHKFDIRYEMDQCLPLGVAAYQCKSELRGLRIRTVSDEELAGSKKKSATASDE